MKGNVMALVGGMRTGMNRGWKQPSNVESETPFILLLVSTLFILATPFSAKAFINGSEFRRMGFTSR
jgi:hypothetical protein